MFFLQVVSEDGSPLIVLAASSEEDAADWIFRLCQVVADTVSTAFFLLDKKSVFQPCLNSDKHTHNPLQRPQCYLHTRE